MAKLGKVSDETQALVDKVICELGYDNYMNIEPISITKQKQLIKVARANATTEYKAKCPDSVFLYIFEAPFERLDEKQQELLIRDALNNVNYDSEKDKIIIGCPQITVSVDGRAKWGDELVNAAECGVHMILQIEEEEKERKQAEREAKKKKK